MSVTYVRRDIASSVRGSRHEALQLPPYAIRGTTISARFLTLRSCYGATHDMDEWEDNRLRRNREGSRRDTFEQVRSVSRTAMRSGMISAPNHSEQARAPPALPYDQGSPRVAPITQVRSTTNSYRQNP